jgi:hypothetical protein
MNAKRKGTRNEHRSRRILETAGHDRQRWPHAWEL